MSYLNFSISQFLHSDLSQNIGWMLCHSLWQITLIAAMYAVFAVALRNRAASLRYLIGCVAMATMLILPMVTFCLLPSSKEAAAANEFRSEFAVPNNSDDALPTANQSNQDAASVQVGQLPIAQPVINTGLINKRTNLESATDHPSRSEFVVAMARPWLPTATVFWALGVLLLSLRPVIGCLRVQTLRSRGVTPLSNSNYLLAQKLVVRLGIRHAVQFAQSALVEVPTVIGYLRPVVLLPASSVTGLTTAELELILAHELAHIRRHDYALNLIQTVIEALLFYHPGMWWVSSQIRQERENCCDDVAVAIRGDRATYIRALAQLEEHRVARPALGATGGSLLMRVQRLLGQPQAEFGYRKSSIWLTALILCVSLTAAAMAGSISQKFSAAPDDSKLAQLNSVQTREIAGWAKQVVEGKLTQKDFVSRLQEIGHESVRALIPLMKDGPTDQVAMDAFEQFLDQPAVQFYLESVLDGLPAKPHRPANLSHCCLSLLAKYSKNLQTASRKTSNVDRCVKFLTVNPYAAVRSLGIIGGPDAYDELVAAFDKLPTNRWTDIANSLAQIGNSNAVPELQQRLRDVELPDGSDRSFTDAIYALSGGGHTNRSQDQGVHFVYPYDGRTIRSFTVDGGVQHFIRRPNVDQATDKGRQQVWKAFRDQTPGPGFTIDGNEIVLLRGLRAFAVNAVDKTKIENLDKWICETPASEFVARFDQPSTTKRVNIPTDGLLLAMDPGRTIYLLKLLKTSEDFEYRISFLRKLPLQDAGPNSSEPETANVDLSQYRWKAQQLEFAIPRLAKIDASIESKGNRIDFMLPHLDPHNKLVGCEPALSIQVTDNGVITKINPNSPSSKNTTASEIFMVNGNVARLTAHSLPGNPATSEIVIVQTTKGTKSINLTLLFPMAHRNHYLKLAKTIAQTLKPIKTIADANATVAKNFQSQQQKDVCVTLIGVYPTKKANSDDTEEKISQDGVLIRYLISRPAFTKLSIAGEKMFDGQHRLKPFSANVAGSSGNTWGYQSLAGKLGVTLPEVNLDSQTTTVVREGFIPEIQLRNPKIRVVIRCGSGRDLFDFPFSDVVVGEPTEPIDQLLDKRDELSEKMRTKYGNRYAVYEMNPDDVRKGERLHLGFYLVKGGIKKPLGITSLGPKSYPGYSRLALAIVDGKAMIERWGGDDFVGNAWQLDDEIRKESQSLSGETAWPALNIQDDGVTQEIATTENGWKLVVEFWRFTPEATGEKKKQHENTSDDMSAVVQPKTLLINISDSGVIRIDQNIFDLQQLTEHARDLLNGKNQSLQVLISVQPDTRYEYVEQAVDAVKYGSGISRNQVDVSIKVAKK